MALETKILPPIAPLPMVEADRRPSLAMLDNDDRIKRMLFDLQLRLDEAEARLALGGL